MRFGDYLGPEAIVNVPEEAGLRYLAKDNGSALRNFSSDDAADLLEEIKRVPVAARANSRPADGEFPLVVHSLGRNGYQLENILLWEYLASRGFVVAVVPQIAEGVYNRGLRFDETDIELQAADIVRTVDYMNALEGVDDDRLFYTGHSAGPVAALVASAERRPLALASFDGAMGSADGLEVLPDLPIEPLRGAPGLILHFYNADNSDYSSDWAMPFIHSGVQLVGFDRATHFDFQLWPLYGLLTETDDPRGLAVRPTARGAEILRSSVQVTGCVFSHLAEGDWSTEDCYDRLPAGTQREGRPSL